MRALSDIAAAEAGITRLALTVKTLINEAVAVVVETITDLERCPDSAVAGAPAKTIRITDLNALLALASVDPAHPRLARNALAADTIISHTVAVVVQPIAHFGARTGRTDADGIPNPGRQAGLNSLPALPGTDATDALITSITLTVDPVIHGTVAVVVQAVAELRTRTGRTDAIGVPHTVDIAGLDPEGTLTHVASARTGFRGCALAQPTIVGHAVAVVV